jgi:hypothetical protein
MVARHAAATDDANPMFDGHKKYLLMLNGLRYKRI